VTKKKASTPSRSRTVTWEDPSIGFETIRAMSGLESLRALKKGEIPPPPFMDLFGIELVEVEEGRVVFELEPEEYHLNWANNVSGGTISTLLDAAMTHAVHSTLAAESGFTTVELKANFVRTISAQIDTLRCEGRVIHTGRRISTAEGRIMDLQERLYAHGTATCMIFPLV